MKLTALPLHVPLSRAEAPDVGSSGSPAIAELLALRDVEVVDVAPLGGVERAARARPSAELLRLPPPPVRSLGGQALFGELGRAVERFDATARQPVRAPREAVTAEARMIALVRGIHGLEAEIRGEISRRARA